MEIENYQIGVMVARFQVHDLHEGHHHVIGQMTSNHKKSILFLGVPKFVGHKKNPLDFETRKRMIQQDYPDTIILPLPDSRYNKKWASELDKRVREVFQHGEVLLYGGRDSFIPHYKDGGGSFNTIEIEPLGTWTGTNIRKTASEKTLSSSDFRAGVIYHALNMYPRVIPTVDVVAYREEKILFVRKYEEEHLRFPGGFILPSDSNVISAAKRILSKETGAYETGEHQIIGSETIDDWRFRGEQDKVMTTVVSTKILWGNPEPSDDIAEIKFLMKEEIRPEMFVEEHRILLKYIS